MAGNGPISETVVSPPAPALRPFIASYAGFRFSDLPPGTHVGLPTSHVELILSLGDPIEVLRMPDPAQPPSAFAALVNGLQQAPAVVRQGGEAFGLHVFVKPLGVRAILGVPSAEVSSLVASLSELWGSRAGELVERLVAAHSWHQRFAILDRVFLSRLDAAAPRPEIAWAWQALQSAHGSVSVERLAREIGWSRRHFSGRFRDAIGVPPKAAARVLRFERACRLLMEDRPSLARLAASCGYFDQAHLTREWRALAGCSPTAWISTQLPFLQDYEIGGSDISGG